MITKFSRTFVENMVRDKIAPENKLRDYDILKDHEEKKLSYSQLAIKYQMARRDVIRIVGRYKKE